MLQVGVQKTCKLFAAISVTGICVLGFSAKVVRISSCKKD